MHKGRNERLSIERFSGNADPFAGDFSGVVNGGRLFSDGQDVGAVCETMIAGNVFKSAEQILMVSSEIENKSGRFLCPAMLVDGVSVSSH